MSPPRQSGFSLTELMVAMTVSLILMYGMGQIFISSKRTYTAQEGLSRLQENGRFAIEMLGRSVRMAGYMGCMAETNLFNNLNNPNAFGWNLDVGIEGFEANGTDPGDDYEITATDPAPVAGTNWSPNLPAPIAGNVLPGSDVVIVRYVNPNSVSVRLSGANQYNTGSQVFVLQTDQFQDGDLLVITDCRKSSLFQATNVQNVGGVPPGTNLVFSAAGTPGNAVHPWPIPAQQYGPESEVAMAEAYAFYVGLGADNRPSLFQLRLQNNAGAVGTVAEELVDGVESMQILYGVDTNGNDQINGYVPADQVADWDQVMAARIALLLRTPDDIQPEVFGATYTVNGTTIEPVPDRRQRRVFSTTITLRNRAP